MNSSSIKAIIVDQSDPNRLAIREKRLAPPAPGEITIRIKTISLNRGEVKRALTVTETGTCPGWDFAGVVEDAASVAGAPKVGTRVVGLVPEGAWAERVRVQLPSIAVIPEEVTDAQAASLPVAGLTALHALRKGGLLLGRKVLIDGVSGGVGQFAVQLAAASGARVYSHVRRKDHSRVVESSSNGGIIVAETLEAARDHGPFDLILDGVGGSALSAALTMLSRNGICVTFGVSESPSVTFDSAAFFRASGTSLQSLILGDDIAATEPAANGLAILLQLVKERKLSPVIGLETAWTEIAEVAHKLVDRNFAGKAVLHLPQ